MKGYSNKSFEELRLEDYSRNMDSGALGLKNTCTIGTLGQPVNKGLETAFSSLLLCAQEITTTSGGKPLNAILILESILPNFFLQKMNI
jgi:hypothetical protein